MNKKQLLDTFDTADYYCAWSNCKRKLKKNKFGYFDCENCGRLWSKTSLDCLIDSFLLTFNCDNENLKKLIEYFKSAD